MKATYTLIYNRRNKLNSQGKAAVVIQVYYRRERKWFNTEIFLTPKEWDEKRSEVSKHHPKADELNKELQEHIEKLKTHERNEAKAGRPLILSSLSLDNPKEAVPAISFTEFWHTWVETDNQLEYEAKRYLLSRIYFGSLTIAIKKLPGCGNIFLHGRYCHQGPVNDPVLLLSVYINETCC